jgi:hypothetical protein
MLKNILKNKNKKWGNQDSNPCCPKKVSGANPFSVETWKPTHRPSDVE